VYLDATGAVTYSTNRQITPPAGETTETFALQISSSAAVGGNIRVALHSEDSGGHVSPEAVVNLKIADKTPPQVSIAEPAPATKFNFGETVTIKVNATDNVAVTQIRYQLSGALNYSGSRTITPAASPASATFTFDVPFGLHDPDVTIHAFARD